MRRAVVLPVFVLLSVTTTVATAQQQHATLGHLHVSKCQVGAASIAVTQTCGGDHRSKLANDLRNLATLGATTKAQ